MLRRPAVLLLLAILAVYWPALGGAYVYDDELLVARNPALQHSDLVALLARPLFGDVHGYWRPLTSLLLWAGHQLGGAAGVHTLSLLLHAAATLLAFALGQRLLGSARPAFWVALLFALHPVQVESVAWCAAINDPLWVTLILLALRSALRWRDGGANGAPWRAGGFCLLALLAKENTLGGLPLVLAAVAWAPLRNGGAAPRGRWRAAVPVLAAAVALWWLLRMLVFGSLQAGLLQGPELPPATPYELASTPVELLGAHLGLLVQPWPLSPFRTYGTPDLLWRFPLAAPVLAGGALLLFPKLRATQVQQFGAALLLVPLVPVVLMWRSLGAYPLADRYLYLAVFGAAVLVVPFLHGRRAWPLLPMLAVLAGGVSFAQTWTWRDQTALVGHGLHRNPTDANLHAMAGDLQLARAQRGEAGALSAARAAYEHADQLAAAAPGHEGQRASATARLGLAWCLLLEVQGQRRPATGQLAAAFQRAVDADPLRPAAWVGLGVAHGIAQQPTEAERAFRKALELDPGHSEAWTNLGNLQRLTNRRDEARESLRQALHHDPGNRQAQQLLDQLR